VIGVSFNEKISLPNIINLSYEMDFVNRTDEKFSDVRRGRGIFLGEK